MATVNLANGWSSTLSWSLTDVATTVDVAAVAGAPARPFQAVILAEGANSDEIVTVTDITSTTLTLTRATEANSVGSTTASAHSAGAVIAHVLTAGSLAAYIPPFTYVDARNYGVKLDCKGVYDAAVDGGALSTVTSATASFTPADTGKTYTLATTTGTVTTGTLTFVGSTSCTMSVAAGGAMSGARLIYGTDDTTAWQAALDAATPGQTVDASSFTWRSLCTGHLNVPAGVHLGLYGRGPFDPQTNPAMNLWGPTFIVVQDNTTGFIELNSGSGLGDFIFYSANQVPPTAATATAFKAFVTTLSTAAGCHIGSPYMANAYYGFLLEGGRHVVEAPQVGALKAGILIDHSEDTISVRRLQCSPYWRICEGLSYTPTDSSLDSWALANAWGMNIYRSDSFWVGELFTYGLYGGAALLDSSDTGQSPRCCYGRIAMMDADLCAYAIYALSVQTLNAVIISSLHSAGNGTGIGTAGQYAVALAAGGTVAPTVVIGSWVIWGSYSGNSSVAAGTLYKPGTEPG